MSTPTASSEILTGASTQVSLERRAPSSSTKRADLLLLVRAPVGFTEHMGRCVYGGLVDEGNSLSDPQTGFRLDVIEALKELEVSAEGAGCDWES